MHILPARASNRAVIGARYAHEFFLDPERLRLRLPSWLLSLASSTTPKPDLIVGLVASPEKVRTRKSELTIPEISNYQEKLKGLAQKTDRAVIISTEKDLDSVIDELRKTLNQLMLSARAHTGKC